MKNHIRLAVVGTGYFSKFHYDAWKRLKVNLVGICSLNEDEANEYLKSTEQRMGIPAVDPFRHGASRLVDALEAC